MITKKQYNRAKQIIEQYENEQLDLLNTKPTTTSIPKEKWGVHRTHCCFEHGCKYGNIDCPVVLGIIKQDYPCEMC